MEYFGLGDHYLDFNEKQLDLKTYLNAIVENEEKNKRILKKNITGVVESAKKQREFINKFLLKLKNRKNVAD